MFNFKNIQKYSIFVQPNGKFGFYISEGNYIFGEETSMDDCKIIALFLDRSENAIYETQNKYGRMIKKIAFGIIRN